MSYNLTLSGVRDLVKANTSRTDKDSLIDQFINLRLQEIIRRHSFQHLQDEISLTVADGVGYSSLDSSILEIFECRMMNSTTPSLSQSIPIWPKKQVKAFYPDVSVLSNGYPALAYIDADSSASTLERVIRFLPKNNGAMNFILTCSIQPSTLVNANDAFPLDGLVSCVVAGATSDLYNSMQMYQDGSFWEGMFEKRLQEAILADRRRPELDIQMVDVQAPASMISPWLDPFAGHSRSGW